MHRKNTLYLLSFSFRIMSFMTISIHLSGKAVGLLFEDDGDGYGYTEGRYLITHYIAERQSSVVTVKILITEGEWERPKRRIHVQLLLGGGAMVLFFHWLKKYLWECISSKDLNISNVEQLDAWGMDGETIQIKMPSESEVSALISTSNERFALHMGKSHLFNMFVATT